MTRHEVDAQHSEVTVVARPRLGPGPGATVRSFDGIAHLDGTTLVSGWLSVVLEGEPAPTAEIDLATSECEIEVITGEGIVISGRAERSAGTFGLGGPPLLNPAFQLRWRLVVVPA